jgi:hypothetical protein
MKLALAALALAVPVALATTSPRPQGTKWKPFQFRGNERFDYKLVVDDGGTPKETGFALDIRKKSEEDFDVTWSIKSALKKDELNEQTLLVGWANAAPAWAIMNPMYAMFVNDLELKEGEKMSLFGAGTVKVTGKETIAGRTGFICQYFQKTEDSEDLVWQWTVDPELALPLKSIVHDGGRETSRAELTGYEKD